MKEAERNAPEGENRQGVESAVEKENIRQALEEAEVDLRGNCASLLLLEALGDKRAVELHRGLR